MQLENKPKLYILQELHKKKKDLSVYMKKRDTIWMMEILFLSEKLKEWLKLTESNSKLKLNHPTASLLVIQEDLVAMKLEELLLKLKFLLKLNHSIYKKV